MHAGVGIVSPAWVQQSLRAGKQQRCLTVSADASRHLPAAPVAGISNQQQPAVEERRGGGTGSTQPSHQQLSGALLASKEARQQAIMELACGGAAAAAGAASGTPDAASARLPGGHPPTGTPAELLVGVLWSVLEPPSAARLEAQRTPHASSEEQ